MKKYSFSQAIMVLLIILMLFNGSNQIKNKNSSKDNKNNRNNVINLLIETDSDTNIKTNNKFKSLTDKRLVVNLKQDNKIETQNNNSTLNSTSTETTDNNYSEQDISSIQNDNANLNKEQVILDDKIKSMNETLINENTTSQELLVNIQNKTKLLEEQAQTIERLKKEKNDKGDMNMLKEVLEKNLEYHSFYQQINLQIEREKDLRAEVKEKIKELQTVETKLDKMFSDIEVNYVQKMQEMKARLENVEKTNTNLKSKLLELEEISQKEQLSRQLNNLGISSSSNDKERESDFNSIATSNSHSKKREEHDKNNDKNSINTDSSIIKSFIIEPKCVNRNSCRVCLEDPECLWCETNNTCKEGDSSGPYDGSCDKFNFNSCGTKECIGVLSCEECISNTNCGWCSDLQKCTEGSKISPIGSICKGSYYHLFKQGRCRSHNSFLK